MQRSYWIQFYLQNCAKEDYTANTTEYLTCSAGNDTEVANATYNVFDKNIFEITSDISHLAVDDVKSRRSSTKSEGICSTDVSFVSISEVYKYIDEEEGVVLFEKRLMKTTTRYVQVYITYDRMKKILMKELERTSLWYCPHIFCSQKAYIKTARCFTLILLSATIELSKRIFLRQAMKIWHIPQSIFEILGCNNVKIIFCHDLKSGVVGSIKWPQFNSITQSIHFENTLISVYIRLIYHSTDGSAASSEIKFMYKIIKRKISMKVSILRIFWLSTFLWFL